MRHVFSGPLYNMRRYSLLMQSRYLVHNQISTPKVLLYTISVEFCHAMYTNVHNRSYRRVKLVGVALYFVIKISRDLNLAAIL